MQMWDPLMENMWLLFWDVFIMIQAGICCQSKFLSSEIVHTTVESHKPTQSCSWSQPPGFFKFQVQESNIPSCTKGQKWGRVAVRICITSWWPPTTMNKPCGLFFICLKTKFYVLSLWNTAREKGTDHSCFSKPFLKDLNRSLKVTGFICVLTVAIFFFFFLKW